MSFVYGFCSIRIGFSVHVNPDISHDHIVSIDIVFVRGLTTFSSDIICIVSDKTYMFGRSHENILTDMDADDSVLSQLSADTV